MAVQFNLIFMRYIILAILTFLLLPSCRKGEVPSSKPGEGDNDNIEEYVPKKIQFSAGLQSSIKNNFSSRAPLDGTVMPQGTSVGIIGIYADVNQDPSNYSLWQLYNGGAEVHELLENTLYTVIDDEGNLYQDYVPEFPSPASQYNGMSFYAYSPHGAIKTETVNFTKNCYIETHINSTDMANTTDYLCTKQVIVPTPDNLAPVKLDFFHVLGRIKFEIFSDRPDINARVNYIEINADCNPDGKLYLETGECKSKSKHSPSFPKTYYYRLNNEISSGVHADFMLYPGTTIYNIKCEISTGEEYENTNIYDVYPRTGQPQIELVAGEYTTMTINFSPKEMNLSSDVVEWVGGENQNIGIDEDSGDVVYEGSN